MPDVNEERSFTDAHGIRIVYDVHPARTPEPRAIVQLAHGVGEHAGRYGELIEHLTAAGYTVYADDHRGHGRTGLGQHDGDHDRLGRLGPGGHRAAVDALWQFTQLIRSENPGRPLILIGHSWGSFLSQILVDAHPETYDAVVLSGSSLRWPGSLNSGDLNKRWRGADATGAEWLASDGEVGAAFLADPLTTSRTLPELFGAADVLRLIGKPKKGLRAQRGRDLSILLMVGRDDPVGGPRSVHRLADAYRTRSGLDDVTTLVYPGARHEIFNDTTRADVFADLLAWLDHRVASRP